ncbi:IS110 family transposase [Pseudoalteromonas xiamenensis]|uniref:IS110 family transposase n=2 Tax=Pseudoalteromonas xiamenensis TaxID=882626 RepID=A0A975DJS8_9GAMM|nr:IS110 family transposase [Pseudoalteromonas xiamenensis]QTH71616.1 IS110 family transposase [Pseudoalteromonas xiamenensis]QTH72035.1 IS110 family transposase [Pseudoalteromonas xiamenensis]QTH72295.1 IS110 family transposase [Pseudoalteromonas xiamenensis]
MALYCGIDLHSNNHVIVVNDENDKTVFSKRIANDLSLCLEYLTPFKEQLVGVAVESTFNWYWLVDGLAANGFHMLLVNTAAVKQYEGLKYSGDFKDAFHLAHLMRLGILPTGYIYPKEQRAVRDMLRRRMQLVQLASKQLLSIQNQIWRSSGVRVSSSQIKKKSFEVTLLTHHLKTAADTNLRIFRSIQSEIKLLEEEAEQAIEAPKQLDLLQTMTGIGPVLGLTILLETGTTARFETVGDYASYCRCVQSLRESNNKKKGEGNAKSGNKYLSWAFSQAAHMAVRYEPKVKAFYDRKYQKKNGIVAIRAVAHKLARAAYYMLKNNEPFDVDKAFG